MSCDTSKRFSVAAFAILSLTFLSITMLHANVDASTPSRLLQRIRGMLLTGPGSVGASRADILLLFRAWAMYEVYVARECELLYGRRCRDRCVEAWCPSEILECAISQKARISSSADSGLQTLDQATSRDTDTSIASLSFSCLPFLTSNLKAGAHVGRSQPIQGAHTSQPHAL
jgi:hypothetical protein